ncbi:MAG: hypothetical protein FD138_106 [Planctomycetota bacterium]|nr:MAG: hypothetical protein FD138_106 [Planctomycetota bacterium]
MSRSWKTFVESCLDGEALAEEIDDFVDQWHEGDFECELAEYLGFSDEEYAEWAERPQSLPVILFAHKYKVPLKDALARSGGQFALAARGGMTSPEEAQIVCDWLTETGRLPQ